MVVGWMAKAKILKPCHYHRKRIRKRIGGGSGSELFYRGIQLTTYFN
jgi:hypothetical protein